MSRENGIGARLRRRARWEWRRLCAGAETLAATPLHDLRAARRSLRRSGARNRGDRVAIYVIFPRDGLEGSHLLAIRALAGAGYAPFVVSNAPLSPTDRDALTGEVWRYVERPNFGYDFGAYRAAILDLAPDLATLKALVLTNDSIWFPLPGAACWLAQAEALGTDLAGGASNYAVEPPPLDGYRTAAWRYDPGRPQFHYCSFALRLGSKVLADPHFLRFWRDFRLSDDKIRTVQRGEIGFSQWLIRSGFSHGATLGMADFGEEIAAADEAALRALVAGLVIPEETQLRDLRDAVLARAGMPGWPAEARGLVLTAVARTGIAYALPAWSFARKGYGLLKKSPLRLDPAGAAETLRFLDTLAGPEADLIRAEARRLAAAHPDQFSPASVASSFPFQE